MSEKINNLFLKRLAWFCFFIAVSFTAIFFVYYTLMVPFLIALFLAYLLMPLTHWLERRLRISHTTSVCLSILMMIIFVTLLFVAILPVLFQQIYVIIEMIPRAREHVMAIWIPKLRAWLSEIEFFRDIELDTHIRQFEFNTFGEPILNAIQQLYNQTGSVLSGIFSFVLIPVIAFFILKDAAWVRESLKSLVPDEFREGILAMLRDMDKALKSVLKGQGLVAAILGVLYMIGFSIIGLNNSVAVGAIAGVCRLVPYLDVVVSLLLSFVIIITDPGSYSWGLPVGVAVIIIVVQTLDGMFITPRVMGESAGLHAGVVIASVIAFGYWLGFAGVLIAIPVIAIAKVLLERLLYLYKIAFLKRQD